MLLLYSFFFSSELPQNIFSSRYSSFKTVLNKENVLLKPGTSIFLRLVNRGSPRWNIVVQCVVVFATTPILLAVTPLFTRSAAVRVNRSCILFLHKLIRELIFDSAKNLPSSWPLISLIGCTAPFSCTRCIDFSCLLCQHLL